MPAKGSSTAELVHNLPVDVGGNQGRVQQSEHSRALAKTPDTRNRKFG